MTPAEQDPEVWACIDAELKRQRDDLELIASENYASEAVLAAQGCVMTNKYAEGLAHKRYYGGCEHVDEVEDLAVARALQLFGADMANVQPHSGSQANMAVYMAALEAGDRVLGMSLSHGGHLTHGSHVNFSGRLYEAAAYGVDEGTGLIDYDALAEQARAFRPKLIVCGASAYSRVIDFERMSAIAAEVDALLLADIAHIAGLVATGHHPTPVPHCDFVTTTTHKTLRGPRGGLVMARAAHGKAVNSRVFPGIQGGPLMHVVAAKAIAFGEALRPSFKTYMQQVVDNASAMAEALQAQGMKIVSGGTDNHLMLVDLTPQDVPGRKLEVRLGRAGITVNKNTVPGEKRSPFVTSGIRIGTPALTTRGMGVDEMRIIAGWIARVAHEVDDLEQIARIKKDAVELARSFPIYPGF